jgi:hypothetical protein
MEQAVYTAPHLLRGWTFGLEIDPEALAVMSFFPSRLPAPSTGTP